VIVLVRLLFLLSLLVVWGIFGLLVVGLVVSEIVGPR
jgi:hypothetical protein